MRVPRATTRVGTMGPKSTPGVAYLDEDLRVEDKQHDVEARQAATLRRYTPDPWEVATDTWARHERARTLGETPRGRCR